jgi:hypothetical protein
MVQARRIVFGIGIFARPNWSWLGFSDFHSRSKVTTHAPEAAISGAPMGLFIADDPDYLGDGDEYENC